MQNIPALRELEPVSLSDLDPSRTPAGEITAVVSLVWPYSSSALRLTAIVAHQDHRRRERRGELKVLFTGYAAESLRRLAIGDVVKLSLEGADWELLPDAQEKDVPWQLRWEKRLRVKVFKDQSAKEPYIDVDRSFGEARLSGVFERIAAAEAIISESQREGSVDFGSQTPQKPSTQASGSWSTSFFGSQQTPINIFAQGRRRLFNTDSDEDDEDVEMGPPSKRARLFEPHQSFRYVSDSPHDDEEEEEDEVVTQRAEDQFFDENSFRTSFRTANESGSRLYVRPDDAANESMDSESFRTALADRSQSSKMYIRPDNSQDDSRRGAKTPEAAGTEIDADTQDTIRETSRDEATSQEIYKIFFGHSPKPPERPEATVDADSVRPLGRLLSTQGSDVSNRVPLAPKSVSSGKASPVDSQGRLSPPTPSALRGVEVESQPMSSFTLEPDRMQPASQTAVGPAMPPPPLQMRRVPLLDTTSLGLAEPITPTLKPAASPALPLPSPFPTSALERGGISFFPSQSTPGTLMETSAERQMKDDPESGTPPPVVPATARAVLAQVQGDAHAGIKQETSSILDTRQTSEVVETTEFTRETITVVKRPSTATTAESTGPHTRIMVEDVFITREDRDTGAQQAAPKQPEVISLLDSSDEYDTGAEAGAISDDEEEDAEFGSEESLEDAAEGNIRDGYIDTSDEDEEDDAGDGHYGEGHNLQEMIEYAEMEEFEFVRHSTPAGEGHAEELEEEDETFNADDPEEEAEEEEEEEASSSKVGNTLVPTPPRPTSYISPSYRARADQNQRQGQNQSPEASASASQTPARRQLEAQSTEGLYGLIMSVMQNLPESSTPTGTPSSQRSRHSESVPRRPSAPSSQGVTPVPEQKQKQRASEAIAIFKDDADSTSTPRPHRRRTLPWRTPRQRVPDAALPRTDPQPARVQSPLPPPPGTEPVRKPTSFSFLNGQGQAKQVASKEQSVARPEAETEPIEEIRRLQRYNTRAKVPAGTVTSLSEFVPLGKLHRLEWDGKVDVMAVNLRNAKVERMEKSPKFYFITLAIIDPSCTDGKGIVVQLMRPYQEALPASVKPGDVLLLRNIRFKSTNHRRSGGSTMSSGWKVWRPRRAKDGTQELVEVPNGGPHVEIGAGELAYANQLWGWWKGIDVDVRVYLINGSVEDGTAKADPQRGSVVKT
ncbi:hypothetical protein TWF696_007174 [Orbilia brochopaga]|uniref:Telomeric single stranded DNA binding POT1/Cdc13 domain-containing protein n=1 Tax=Orbilia brochopaga TaxID=3140254 RepID=A0AAV9UUF2_9PEZI